MSVFVEAALTAARDAPLRTRPMNCRVGCATSSRAKSRARGRRALAPPDARPRNSKRSGCCPSRAEIARTVTEHVTAEEVVGQGEIERERRAGGRGHDHGRGDIALRR